MIKLSVMSLLKKAKYISLLACFVAVSSFALAQSETNKTEIITDEENDMITFVIDGKPVGQLTKEGLHINGDVFYNGAMQNEAFDIEINKDDEGQEDHAQ